ncbi:hypothetical protein L596_025597 [Steinernema carpocapsae]|uniref:Large ribosomal subunit protein uL22m n=1 Tax=Steinernema carpocapsae TaxID=34508 RepID=A0A4U5M894_STECR|nr:hypothetical protein L596_025597 [Steinernema carpocapsae]
MLKRGISLVSAARLVHSGPDGCSLVRTTIQSTNLSNEEKWKRREQFGKPTIQRIEKLSSKVYFSPEWPLDKRPNGDEGPVNPLMNYGTTPEKWEYYNKVVWPPNYIVPETGLPKPKEVFHCRQSIHYSPKRMWHSCQFAKRMNVDEAILQLRYKLTKGCLILAEVLEEAKDRAKNEFHIEYPSEMYIAEAFPIQSEIVKGARRAAREQWSTIRYRYIHLYVRLEEGQGPSYKGRAKHKDGWEKMDDYYTYLRSRQIKYSI